MKLKTIIIAAMLSVLICVTGSISVNAVSLYVDGDYTYADIDRDNVALYAYDGENKILTVPEYFYGRAVSEIYDYAFEENSNIYGLDFSQNGNRLKVINTKAFNECTELAGDLNLPSSVRTLGFAAFQGCVKLESLTVNYGVVEIPAQCFNRCSALKTVTLAPSVENIGNLAFAKCTSLEKVYLPTSVTYISTSAFNDSPNVVLNVYTDSYAHQYAKDKNLRYILIDGPKTGDANGDGMVDILDSTEIQKFAAEMIELSDEQFELADINNDGFVDVIDALLVQKYVVGKYDIPPIIFNS